MIKERLQTENVWKRVAVVAEPWDNPVANSPTRSCACSNGGCALHLQETGPREGRSFLKEEPIIPRALYSAHSMLLGSRS